MARLCWLLLPLLLAGCGYHPLGRGALPEGIDTVYVELFENRTLEPFLENTITNEVVEEFSRRRGLRVIEEPSKAEARLEGQVQGYRVDAISFDPDDRIGQFRVTITIEAALRKFDSGRMLWKGQLSWSEEYPINQDKSIQEDNEAAAVREIADRLAENLYFHLQQNF